MTFQKGQIICTNGKNMKCILADHEYALFGAISNEVDEAGDPYTRTNFEELGVYDNTGTCPIDYETLSNPL